MNILPNEIRSEESLIKFLIGLEKELVPDSTD